ncbi:MAG TPA: hypothetical protein VL588_01320 [Bdellovibrionota bacterium]|jgi:hypothetical protein|nr:hypothetical protein [Bdellovibrionota bacterium]
MLKPSLSKTLLLATVLSLSAAARADQVKSSQAAASAAEAPLQQAQAQAAAAPAPAEDEKVRNFYQVLQDVLGDFEFDLKNGEVEGLKNISVRNVGMSENVPPSFKSHLELLVTEKILNTTKSKVIQCLPCKSKTARLNNDYVVISTPGSNPQELTRLAAQSGINNFMDIAFAYQPTGMMLSLTVTDSDSGAVVWSKSYNSETSRAAAFRRGVDYSQVDEARTSVDYVPTIQYRPTIYWFLERNVGNYTSAMAVGFRMMERYDNRKKEVGFELNYLLDTNALVGNTQNANTNLYAGFNLTLLFIHAWNLIGELENYNQVRQSIFAGIGGTFASGFLGGLVRAGYEWRLGKHWAVNTNVGFRPAATRFVGGSGVGSVSGVEIGLGISALF